MNALPEEMRTKWVNNLKAIEIRAEADNLRLTMAISYQSVARHAKIKKSYEEWCKEVDKLIGVPDVQVAEAQKEFWDQLKDALDEYKREYKEIVDYYHENRKNFEAKRPRRPTTSLLRKFHHNFSPNTAPKLKDMSTKLVKIRSTLWDKIQELKAIGHECPLFECAGDFQRLKNLHTDGEDIKAYPSGQDPHSFLLLPPSRAYDRREMPAGEIAMLCQRKGMYVSFVLPDGVE